MNGTERKVCPFSLWECERRAFCTCRNIAHARQEQHPYYGNLRPLLPKSDQQTNETTKPPLTYTQLIVQAIQSSPEKQLTSSAICTYISQNYPYYKMVDKSWKLGITTKLYKNPRFIKVLYDDLRHNI